MTLLGGRAKQKEWLAITRPGFFAGSRDASEMLTIVRGVEPFVVTQFYDHRHRPDLVGEAIKGDPEGKHKDAAWKLNLGNIF